jgi:hypothetical protein
VTCFNVRRNSFPCLTPHLFKTANITNVVTDKILSVARDCMVSSR